MRIILKIEDINLAEDLPACLDEQLVDTLLTCMKKLTFWDSFQYVREEKGYRKFMSTVDNHDLKAYFTREDDTYRTKGIAFEEDGKSRLSISIRPSSVILILGVTIPDEIKQRVVPNLKAFLLEFMSVFPDTESVGRNIGLCVDTPFYRIRPTYTMIRCRWEHGSILDMIDERHLAEDKQEEVTVMHAIAKLPTFAKYEKLGHFHVITWINDLSNKAKIAQCLTERNKWLHTHIPLTRDTRFNELGDGEAEDVYVGMDTHSCLTYYAESYNDDFETIYMGFQSVQVMPDGSTDASLLQNLSTWVKQKKLPDGSPVDTISVIAQDRNAALLILDKAQKLGLDNVLYMDDDEKFWAINPSGLWLN